MTTRIANEVVGQQERRIGPRGRLEIRTAGSRQLKLTGHAAVFDSEAQIDGFREIVRPGAFRESIRTDDIRFLMNHAPDSVMARNRSGTLHLEEDRLGLRIQATLDPEDWDVRRLVGKVKAGHISGMSFAFAVPAGGDRWSGDKKPLRELLKVTLYDVSAVTFPAYDSTSVAVRARAQQMIDWRGQSELRKRRLQLAEMELPTPPAYQAPTEVLLQDREVNPKLRELCLRAATTAARELGIPVPQLRFFRSSNSPLGLRGWAVLDSHEIFIRCDLEDFEAVETTAHECLHRYQVISGQRATGDGSRLERAAEGFGKAFAERHNAAGKFYIPFSRAAWLDAGGWRHYRT